MIFGLVSLGCEKNLVDSELILGYLQKYGHLISPEPTQCDAIIINTCGFIEDSKRESIDTILEMAKFHKPLIVTGCLAQRYKDVLQDEMPEIDYLIPISDYDNFGHFLKKLDAKFKNDGLNFENRVLSTPEFTAYLRIADGCSNCCTYCAIPLIRGPIKSRKIEEILDEAKLLEKKGIKEVTLVAQDTTKYGIDIYGKPRIEDLLHVLLDNTNFLYIRLLYLYPDEISDELIELIGTNPRLTPYFDVPIQHSETSILKAMNRRGDKEFLAALFNKIRTRVPNAILRTTIMVGFPGETQKDVDNLIDFISEVEFDHLGCFTYSREDDTKSYDFTDQIDEDVKKERKDRVMKCQQHISYKRNKTHVGEIMEGLIIGIDESGSYHLRSYWNAIDDIDGSIIITSKKPLSIGQKVRVKIQNALIYDLYGEVVE